MSEQQSSRQDQIKVSAGQVTRPAGPWTASVHKFLRHARNLGLTNVPNPLSLNSKEEVVSLVAGDVLGDHDNTWRLNDDAITSAAELLKNYHYAGAYFIENGMGEEVWSMPALHPAEVICHCDFAPYNVAFEGNRVVGLFDFDAARPGPKLWDIAYAIYRWAPYCGVSRNEISDLELARSRAVLFCETYGLSDKQVAALNQEIPVRIESLAQYMIQQSDMGDARFKSDIERGDHQLYLDDANWLRENPVLPN